MIDFVALGRMLRAGILNGDNELVEKVALVLENSGEPRHRVDNILLHQYDELIKAGTVPKKYLKQVER